jgi:ABC-2 type transport system ATP-binding protein
MSHSPIIKTSGLFYHYSKDVQTLHDINLCVEKGSIYGFLGPNGAGKTTTLSLLLGLFNKQEGEIEIFGQPLHTNRISILKRIGSLIETPSLYGHLTARENLEVYRNIYGVSTARISEVLKMAGIADTGRKSVRKFSLGMKQRLSIALALLPNPELLILDEPSNGLDPAGIIELRELIQTLNREHGMTIVISSHLLSEVEKMVSHLGIIYQGKLLFQGTLTDLHLARQKSSTVIISTSNNPAAVELLQEFDPQLNGEGFSLAFQSREQLAAINRTLTQNNLDVYMLQPRQNNLEQLFIDLTSAPL